MGDLFTDLCSSHCLPVPKNFIALAVKAMGNLEDAGRTNVLYDLAVGLGSSHPGDSKTRFPNDHMPMGLLEYVAKFFASENMNEVGIILCFW